MVTNPEPLNERASKPVELQLPRLSPNRKRRRAIASVQRRLDRAEWRITQTKGLALHRARRAALALRLGQLVTL